jgi:hypothetical protein
VIYSGEEIMISHEDNTTARPSLTERREFMRLPLEERHKMLALQSNQAAEYYGSPMEQAV